MLIGRKFAKVFVSATMAFQLAKVEENIFQDLMIFSERETLEKEQIVG